MLAWRPPIGSRGHPMRRALFVVMLVACRPVIHRRAVASVDPSTSPRRGDPAAASGEWTHYSGNAASHKYSPLDQINKDTIGKLQIAWRWASPDNAVVEANPTSRPGGYADTPLMVKGVLYTVTSLGQIAAINPATGQSIWVFDPGKLEDGPSRQSRLRASRPRVSGPTGKQRAPAARHARRLPDLDRREDRRARHVVRRRRPRRSDGRRWRTPCARRIIR